MEHPMLCQILEKENAYLKMPLPSPSPDRSVSASRIGQKSPRWTMELWKYCAAQRTATARDEEKESGKGIQSAASPILLACIQSMATSPACSRNDLPSHPSDLQDHRFSFYARIPLSQEYFTDTTNNRSSSRFGALSNTVENDALTTAKKHRPMTTRDQTLFKTHMPSFTSQEKGNINTENTAKKIFNSSLFHESNGNCDRSEPVLHRKLFFNRTNKQRVRDPTRAITDLPLGSYLRHHVSLGRKNCQIPLTLRHDTEICKSSEEFCHVDRSQTLPRARSDFQRSAIVKLRNFTNDGMEAILANEITATDEDLTVFESQLAGQFKRLLSAIDGVSKQMQIAFEGLHESVDDLQASLDVEYTFGWRKHSDHLHRARVKQTSCISRDICVQQRTHRWETLEEAMEMVRDSIRHLTESLITEKEDALLGGNYHDKQMILTKMMHPYLEKPSFEKTSHTKYGLNRCIASVLFKASNVLARSQNVMGSFSGSKSNVKDSDEVLFKRFCKKGQKGLEAIAKMDESKWSVQLKNLFFNACKSTWQLQTLRVARMSSHQIEFLWPEAGSRLDEASMDPLDSLSEGHFQPIVQFTVFPGLKVEQSILIKAQVYLHPSYPFMMST